ncbi:Transposase [Cordylochernes scorpioides]|uniref:Transposase n=1 Tax=Cordylochernes scorpioides TaxID=51811 RepID=A0ABY6LT76_9ARAC|nr:Transposase [Cordylochernes scorpioides]
MNGIRHTKTSPYNPSTNGLAERYVREFKNLLRKNNGKDDLETNLQSFLFAHRALPQTVIKEFTGGTANEEKFKVKILEFNTKMGNPREVFHEAPFLYGSCYPDLSKYFATDMDLKCSYYGFPRSLEIPFSCGVKKRLCRRSNSRDVYFDGSLGLIKAVQSWSQFLKMWFATPMDSRTISRRLVANGLHSCRPLRRLPLTPPNRRQRLEWCRARSTWMTEWHRVVFSDESRFCLSSDSRRVREWRRRGERSNPAAIVERPTVRQRGIMVWGAIAYDSRSPLLRIQGTMTAQRYVDDVLRPVTLPYLQGVPNALYQQDNARPHTARISQQALQDVQMLPWPPYSPDLSPIEHVWDIIGRRLHALPEPRSEDELWQMVEREWRAIPQDAIRTLIDSLPRRVAACIAVRGGPTCY